MVVYKKIQICFLHAVNKVHGKLGRQHIIVSMQRERDRKFQRNIIQHFILGMCFRTFV